MDLYAAGSAIAVAAAAVAAEEGGAGIQVNLFWIIVAAGNFVLFLVILTLFAWKPITRTLDDRRAKIEQGLKDAEQARLDLERASATAIEELGTARREAREIVDRSQRVAQDAREADIAATREELERMRVRAAAEIEAEKSRAIADLRAEVADLAISAAGRIVGESMTGDRQRRLVEEFLAESTPRK
ncbi:MAG: F0F1 ATP synthase subunit B [Chloroflexota bacterium]